MFNLRKTQILRIIHVKIVVLQGKYENIYKSHKHEEKNCKKEIRNQKGTLRDEKEVEMLLRKQDETHKHILSNKSATDPVTVWESKEQKAN